MPDLTDPTACRKEAVRLGYLADEENRAGNWKAVREHIERARELALLALKIEAQPKGD